MIIKENFIHVLVLAELPLASLFLYRVKLLLFYFLL